MPYIMGVAQIPAGFEHVKAIEPDSEGIVLLSSNGKSARARVDLDFLAADGAWWELGARIPLKP